MNKPGYANRKNRDCFANPVLRKQTLRVLLLFHIQTLDLMAMVAVMALVELMAWVPVMALVELIAVVAVMALVELMAVVAVMALVELMAVVAVMAMVAVMVCMYVCMYLLLLLLTSQHQCCDNYAVFVEVAVDTSEM